MRRWGVGTSLQPYYSLSLSFFFFLSLSLSFSFFITFSPLYFFFFFFFLITIQLQVDLGGWGGRGTDEIFFPPSSLPLVRIILINQWCWNTIRNEYEFRIRPYHAECTRSHPNSEVKLHWAGLVLGWGTTREQSGVVSKFFFPRVEVCEGLQLTRVRSKKANSNNIPVHWKGGGGGMRRELSNLRKKKNVFSLLGLGGGGAGY